MPAMKYYGRPTNYRSLWQFYRGVRRIWKKWLERRSRGKTLSWADYEQLLQLPAAASLDRTTLGPDGESYLRNPLR